jgi:HD superfamily phosphohydrolase
MLIEALKGCGPIGQLISSKSVDLDNIDNVFRMAGALGIRNWSYDDPIKIARSICIKRKDDTLTCREGGLESLKRWVQVRRKVYEILNLHPLNLAGLAMLREAFETHAEAAGKFPSSAWWTVDAEVLENISIYTEHITDRIKRGDLYHTLYILCVDTSDKDLQPIEKLTSVLHPFSNRLADALDYRVRVHIVLDNGTFERRIELFLADNKAYEAFGVRSRSVVVSIHSQSNSNNYPSKEKIERILPGLLADCFNVGVEKIKNAVIGNTQYQTIANTESSPKQIQLW